MKPIVVFTPDDNHIKEFSRLDSAKRYAECRDGVIYRREDWYQHLQMWVRILIGRV